jgi:hypothetical protein
MATGTLLHSKRVSRNPLLVAPFTYMMPTKLQSLRKELRGSRARRLKRGHRLSEDALRKESAKQSYGTLGPASPAKRIDPNTGEVVEIISEERNQAASSSTSLRAKGE